jgi:GntR family transcriptional regulator, transcriptional repressor for pyruvate dehydrogenase complex
MATASHSPLPERLAVAAVFGPVQAPTTFEETVERLGTAIRLGLLAAGSRLPPERELSEQLGISRSTLRHAITTLTQSGHLVSLRGRAGGTFVADAPPLAEAQEAIALEGRWRDLLDFRIAIEAGAALLAAERAQPAALARMQEHVDTMDAALEDFTAYRHADVFFHLGLAEAAQSARLLAAMTEVQGQMSELIGHIAHPAPVLARSNEQHAEIVAALERGDGRTAAQIVREHLKGTEQVLAGLMPRRPRDP